MSYKLFSTLPKHLPHKQWRLSRGIMMLKLMAAKSAKESTGVRREIVKDGKYAIKTGRGKFGLSNRSLSDLGFSRFFSLT